MSEHGGSAPAGRRSPLGDADRERLVALLREHYAAGRLDLDDLRHRVGVVLAAAYAEEAAVALADLPPAGVPDTAGAGRGAGCPPLSGSALRPAAWSCGSGSPRQTRAATTYGTTPRYKASGQRRTH